MAQIARQETYKDADFTFKENPNTNDVAIKKNNEAVKQSVLNILRTNHGERPFNYFFGANLRSYLFENMTNEEINEKFVIVSPDEGGIKRTLKIAGVLGLTNYEFCHKQRIFDKPGVVGEMKLLNICNLENKNAIICDDICDSGGTLMKCIDLLVANGVKDVYCVITHGIFTKNALQNICLLKIDVEGFEKNVLAGLRNTLERSRPIAVVEVTYGNSLSFASLDELKASLPADYALFRFNNRKADGSKARRRGAKAKRSGDYQLIPFDEWRISGQDDVIACPKEKLGQLPSKNSV